MDLFEDSSPGNAPALSVSEIAGAVKRVIEGEFGRVRVRGEVGRVTLHRSGHVYFDLKDERACIAAVCWRATAQGLRHRPEEGMEVIASGRLTTYAPGSKYQLVVESIEPAGVGALMALRKQLVNEIDENTDSLRFYLLGKNWRPKVEHRAPSPHTIRRGRLSCNAFCFRVPQAPVQIPVGSR